MSFQRMFQIHKNPRRRFLLAPVGSLLLLTIFVPLLAGSGLVGAGGSILGWRLGVAMWLLSLVLLGLSVLISFRQLRAQFFYIILLINAMPALIALLDAGMRILASQFPFSTMVIIGLGLILGLIGLPWSIKARRRWFRAEISDGHLQRSLNRTTAEWDPTHDMDKALQDERISKPGCLMRLLPWIGPAIGMSLARIVGRANAFTVIGGLALTGGYAGLYTLTTFAIAYSMDFRELSRQLGRPIYITPETSKAFLGGSSYQKLVTTFEFARRHPVQAVYRFRDRNRTAFRFVAFILLTILALALTVLSSTLF